MYKLQSTRRPRMIYVQGCSVSSNLCGKVWHQLLRECASSFLPHDCSALCQTRHLRELEDIQVFLHSLQGCHCHLWLNVEHFLGEEQQLI